MGERSAGDLVSFSLGVDLSPLRISRTYRRLYAYNLVAGLGSQAVNVTMFYQLTQATHSPVVVGTFGIVELLPLLLGAAIGGVIADRWSRRRVSITCETGVLLTMALMAWSTSWSSFHVPMVFICGATMVGLTSLQSPSLTALTQQVVPHDMQRATATLGMVSNTAASIIGPGIGGFVAASSSPRAVYVVYCVMLAVTISLLRSLTVRDHAGQSERISFAAAREGARYVTTRPDIVGTYIIDTSAMIFAYPVAILAFLAVRSHSHFDVALFYVGLPTGAFLATVTSRWTKNVRYYGRVIVVAAGLWGVGVVIAGISSMTWLIFAGLVFAGGADAVSAIFRQTMWNESIFPELRGRMASIEMLSYSVGPTLGQFRSGLMTQWLGAQRGLLAGGVVATASNAVLGASLRSLWNFDRTTDPHVAAVALERSQEDPAHDLR